MTPVSMVNQPVINSKATEPIFDDGVGGDVDDDGDGNADGVGSGGATVVVLVVVVAFVVVVVIRVDTIDEDLLTPETR